MTDPILTSQTELHGGEDFIARHTRELSLRDGARLCLRPIMPTDKANLQAGFRSLSADSRYRRFMIHMRELTERQLEYFTEIDYRSHFAWVAFSLDSPERPGVAVARYVRDKTDRSVAEPAIAVTDAFQGRGLGSLLLLLLATTASEHGIRQFRASLLRDNQGMRSLLEHQGAVFRNCEYGVLCADIELPEREAARRELLLSLLRLSCDGTVERARAAMTGDASKPVT